MLVGTTSSVFDTVQLGAKSPNSYIPAFITRVWVYQTCIVRIISHVTEMQALLKKRKPLTKHYISCKQTSMRLQGNKAKRGDHDPEALLKWIHSKLPHFSFFRSMNAARCSVFHSSVPPSEYTDRQHTHPGHSQLTHPDQSLICPCSREKHMDWIPRQKLDIMSHSVQARQASKKGSSL